MQAGVARESAAAIGTSHATLREWLADAGLVVPRFHALPPDPAANGPALFSCVARHG